MNIHAVRRIDFWVGVPLCFLLTLVDKTLRLFSFKGDGKDIPNNILFIKPSEMGGIILSLPLLRRIQKDYPEAQMFFLTFESNKGLFDVLDVIPVKNVFTIRDDSVLATLLDTIKVLLKIRKIKADVVFDLEFFSRFTAIISYLTGAAKRVGFYRYTLEGLYRGNLLTHNIHYNSHLHISKTFLSMGQVIGQQRKTTPELLHNFTDEKIVLPQFIPTVEEKETMKDRLIRLGVVAKTRLFLVNPGEGRIPLREWPLDNFIILARKLLEDENSFIIIAGASDDAKKSEKFYHEVGNKRCIHLSGKTTLRELLTLSTMAEALITNDSGLAHLASFTPINQFVFFGPESPCVFSSLGDNTHVFYSNWPCSPCLSAYNHRNSACNDNRCLKAIDPQEVYKVISEKICPTSLKKFSRLSLPSSKTFRV